MQPWYLGVTAFETSVKDPREELWSSWELRTWLPLMHVLELALEVQGLWQEQPSAAGGVRLPCPSSDAAGACGSANSNGNGPSGIAETWCYCGVLGLARASEKRS